MAELAVRVNFTNTPRRYTLAALKLTFPLWGVAAPITSICCLAAGYFTWVADHMLTTQQFVSFLAGFALMCIFATGLLMINWLTKDSITIDKDGVTLPWSPFRGLRSLTWGQIKSIQLAHSQDKSWQTKQLAFVTPKGTTSLQLSHIEATNIEKLVLALEMWGTATDIDVAVHSLKDEVSGKETAKLSYTDMWEEELGRRFNPTAFVPLEPGKVMRNGTLKIVRHLALGGLSAVYLCQMEDRKLVVLKEAVVSDDATESAQSKAHDMLEKEAALLLKLSHPNIVSVLDNFVEQGRNYLMLDYISGQDLRQLVKQNGPQKESTVIEWALQMAASMKYLHEQDPPMIHRDFTPDNLVLCDDGSIVVIDFGAANEFIGTATGTFVGKHAYIAPEQFRGKAVVQSDIYAFGCTLFFLLTGEEPEALSTSDPQQAGVRVSSDLCELIVTCTQMEPRDRYQSAAQLIPVLRGLAAASPALA